MRESSPWHTSRLALSTKGCVFAVVSLRTASRCVATRRACTPASGERQRSAARKSGGIDRADTRLAGSRGSRNVPRVAFALTTGDSSTTTIVYPRIGLRGDNDTMTRATYTERGKDYPENGITA